MQLRSRRELERTDVSTSRHPEYRYKTEFQSHEPEVCCRIWFSLSPLVSFC